MRGESKISPLILLSRITMTNIIYDNYYVLGIRYDSDRQAFDIAKCMLKAHLVDTVIVSSRYSGNYKAEYRDGNIFILRIS